MSEMGSNATHSRCPGHVRYFPDKDTQIGGPAIMYSAKPRRALKGAGEAILAGGLDHC